jgi:hypothetical protein
MAYYAYHIGQIVYIGKQLNIPKGKSEEYLQYMQEKHKEK